MLLFINDSATPPAVVASYPDGTTLSLSVHPNATRTMTVPDGTVLVPLPDGAPGYAAPPIDLTAYAASARYAKETAGIAVGTSQIATDRASQALITGMWAAAQITPSISVAFKSGTGFVTINAQQVEKIATAVAAHVQACFTAEAQVDQAITAGTITTTAQIDAAFAAVTA